MFVSLLHIFNYPKWRLCLENVFEILLRNLTRAKGDRRVGGDRWFCPCQWGKEWYSESLLWRG
jgi:hypothetical protein